MSNFADAYFPRPAPAAVRTVPARIVAPLHLNEMPSDIPAALRRRLLARFERVAFNRYPEPFAHSLADALADWYGCSPDEIMVGPGSSSFIRLLLSYFGPRLQGRLVITRPSFVYYEQFCRAFGLAYDTWELDDSFRYVPADLADLPPFSLVFLTSPNNPSGSTIAPSELEDLLRAHPDSLFVVDEAYAEFAGQDMLPLVPRHDNLVLLRTFSKAMGIPALRCGILIANPALVSHLMGLQTPWQLSALAIEGAKEVLRYARETNWMRQQVDGVVAARQTLEQRSRELVGETATIHPSEANFIFLQARHPQLHGALVAACRDHGVAVDNPSALPRLEGCLRVTVGEPAHNALFLTALDQAVSATAHLA